MEGLMVFISIIFIVFGILQICLFFKMWGMANNISKIRRGITYETGYMDATTTTGAVFKDTIKLAEKCIFVRDTKRAQEYLLSLKYDILTNINSLDETADKYSIEILNKRIQKIDELLATIK